MRRLEQPLHDGIDALRRLRARVLGARGHAGLAEQRAERRIRVGDRTEPFVYAVTQHHVARHVGSTGQVIGRACSPKTSRSAARPPSSTVISCCCPFPSATWLAGHTVQGWTSVMFDPHLRPSKRPSTAY